MFLHSCCVVLVVIALIVSIGIGAYCGNKYMNRNKKIFLNMTASIKQQVINVNGKYQRN